mgnify:CR=1 FL=1
MSDKQQSMFVPYTESKSKEERIAYVKANPDKYKPLAQYRKEQAIEKKVDTLVEMVQRLVEYQSK